MCNLYSHIKGPKAIRDIANAMGGDWLDSVGNLEPQPAIFPDALAPVVRNNPAGGRELIKMRWGFPVPDPKPGEKKKPGYQTNIRRPQWKQWLPWMEIGHRCLVPSTSFCEYQDGSKVPTWFALSEERPLYFFAGCWMPWNGHRGTKSNPADGEHLLYSFLTTSPNAEVAPVHSKAMPVILDTAEAREIWMKGSVAEALALQRQAPDGTLKIVATGQRTDGPAGIGT